VAQGGGVAAQQKIGAGCPNHRGESTGTELSSRRTCLRRHGMHTGHGDAVQRRGGRRCCARPTSAREAHPRAMTRTSGTGRFLTSTRSSGRCPCRRTGGSAASVRRRGGARRGLGFWAKGAVRARWRPLKARGRA
jgi:hypothetical protein